MVDWKDPNLIAYIFFLYEQITVVLVGFYGCVCLRITSLFAADRSVAGISSRDARSHFVNTFYVELELIQRKRAFRLVHIPFLLARYITLTALLFLCVRPYFWFPVLSCADICVPNAGSIISGRVRGRIACDRACTLSPLRLLSPDLRHLSQLRTGYSQYVAAAHT